MADISTVNLTHIYSEGTPFEHTAINNINLQIPKGQLVGLLGHTGSGKSTLIQHLNALLQPTAGQVLLGDIDINRDKKTRYLSRFRIGLVFQYPEYQLFEETVFRDIAFGPRNMKLDEKEIEERVKEAADFSGVSEDLFEKSPLELSGGQKRRIAIAGVIAMRPEVLILDEPTAGLDPAGSRFILNNITRYCRETRSTVIIVSHNMDDIARIADRLIVLNQAEIVLDGSPDEVFSHVQQLREIGLDIPKTTEIAFALEKRGIQFEGPVYRHEQLLQGILTAKENASC